jgi:hypothetical protein
VAALIHEDEPFEAGTREEFAGSAVGDGPRALVLYEDPRHARPRQRSFLGDQPPDRGRPRSLAGHHDRPDLQRVVDEDLGREVPRRRIDHGAVGVPLVPAVEMERHRHRLPGALRDGSGDRVPVARIPRRQQPARATEGQVGQRGDR